MHLLMMFITALSSVPPAAKVLAVAAVVYSVIQVIKRSPLLGPYINGWVAVALNVALNGLGAMVTIPSDQLYTSGSLLLILTAALASSGIHGSVKLLSPAGNKAGAGVLAFLAFHHRAFLRLSLVLLTLTAVLGVTGCGVAAWLTDAGSVIAVVGASFTSIASFIAGLTGNVALAALLAKVSSWITEVQTGISDLQQLVAQYQTSPSTSLLAKIEAALDDVRTNVAQDFSNLGLPTTILSVISGIAALAENLLTEWSTAIAGVKAATTSAEFKVASARLADLADALPTAISSYRSSVNGILSTTTGDPEVDAALAKAARV